MKSSLQLSAQMVVSLCATINRPRVCVWRMLAFSHLRHRVPMNPVDAQDFCEATKHIESNEILFLNICSSVDGHVYFWLTLRIIAIASSDKKRGYRTSSFTIESKTSSSSSPGNGDCSEICIHELYVWFVSWYNEKKLTSPTSISNIKTPKPHQSTALVYDVSVSTTCLEKHSEKVSFVSVLRNMEA